MPETYDPCDYPGRDAEPGAHVVGHRRLMSGSNIAELYPGLVGLDDVVARKTGFSALAAGNSLEILTEHGSDTVVIGALTTPICVGTASAVSA